MPFDNIFHVKNMVISLGYGRDLFKDPERFRAILAQD